MSNIIIIKQMTLDFEQEHFVMTCQAGSTYKMAAAHVHFHILETQRFLFELYLENFKVKQDFPVS